MRGFLFFTLFNNLCGTQFGESRRHSTLSNHNDALFMLLHQMVMMIWMLSPISSVRRNKRIVGPPPPVEYSENDQCNQKNPGNRCKNNSGDLRTREIAHSVQVRRQRERNKENAEKKNLKSRTERIKSFYFCILLYVCFFVVCTTHAAGATSIFVTLKSLQKKFIFLQSHV
jgi:hypothetical protein